ncbi:MAG TPA: hypothetical protein VLY24_14590 [Bryobacteraceae bacterium]|nr:hypothetical protein [Bryobacteraceae bacterium]
MAFAADKESTQFRPPAADTFEHRQTNSKVTIGADPYTTPEKERAAFGKLDLYSFGVLPVLVLIQNNSDKAIRLDGIKAVYAGPNRNRVDATPAKDVRYINGPNQPNVPTSPLPTRKKKNPLDAWEVEGRAFVAKTLPPGESASGFFYFQAGLQPGATIYLNGLTVPATGEELFYFEIPLN